MTANNVNERIVELLAATELFGTLDSEDLAICAADFREAHFAKGEKLFARGDQGTDLHVISEGQVRLAIATSEGAKLSFEVASTGALFGEIAVLDGWPRSAEATALATTTTYTLDRNDFNRLRYARPTISDAVILFLCRRLRDLSDKLESIALYPIDVRLARFLLTALGNRHAPVGRRVAVEVPFSQNELALLLGASRPKLNAALSNLENVGAVGRTSDRLFCDRTILASLAKWDNA
jgi:CRP/FNR family cyclic AMP-dependent transcriptional regulator